MSFDNGDRCCQCPAASNRCATDQCRCYNVGKKCNSNCEHSKWNADCLNQTITRCYCAGGVGLANATIGGGTSSKSSSSKDKNVDHHHRQLLQSNCGSFNCDCFKFREKCNAECRCKGECTNTVQKFVQTPTERPYISCKCGSGKKSCHKNDKCACKKLFQHCSPACKCKSDCANGKFDMDLTKSTKLCFVSPDQDTSAAVVRLIGAEMQHNFQFELTNEKYPNKHVEEMFYEYFINVLTHYTLPVRRIIIYLSKSPCFHQDCEPKCEVLNECYDNKACAKLLATLHRQIRVRLNDTNVQTTVKFLFPYIKRGDLFTKQGILALMEAGVTVEPIGIKEWGELLKDKSDIVAEATPLTFVQCHAMWSTCGMDGYVRQSQQYINDGRKTLGMKESYWCSGVHELLKMSLEATCKSLTYYDEIAKRLTKLDDVNKTTTSKPTSRDATLTSTNEQKTEKKSKKKYMSRSNTGPTVLKNGQPAKLTVSESNHDDLTFGVTTTNKKSPADNNLLSSSTSNLLLEEDAATGGGGATTSVINNANVDRLLLTLSNRNITEEERLEIKNDLTTAVENIKFNLSHFVEIIEHRITSTSL